MTGRMGMVLGAMALLAAATARGAEADPFCAAERVAAVPACPDLRPAGETTMGVEVFGETRLREWRPGLGEDTTLMVYLGKVGAGNQTRYAARAVPVRRSCLDGLIRNGVEARFIQSSGAGPDGARPDGARPDDARPDRAGGLVPSEAQRQSVFGPWFVELRLRQGEEQVAVALGLIHLRVYHWPATEAGEVGRSKFRSRRERMHAGMN